MSDDAQAGYDLPNFSIDLTGQVALVTGTTSGLGRRFARVLAACGAKVALTGRRTERLAELAEEIKAAGGATISVPLDMQQTDSILAMVEQVEPALGPLSILINNAGNPDAQQSNRVQLTTAVLRTPSTVELTRVLPTGSGVYVESVGQRACFQGGSYVDFGDPQ